MPIQKSIICGSAAIITISIITRTTALIGFLAFRSSPLKLLNFIELTIRKARKKISSTKIIERGTLSTKLK
jgi:hypothetical protein